MAFRDNGVFAQIGNGGGPGPCSSYLIFLLCFLNFFLILFLMSLIYLLIFFLRSLMFLLIFIQANPSLLLQVLYNPNICCYQDEFLSEPWQKISQNNICYMYLYTTSEEVRMPRASTILSLITATAIVGIGSLVLMVLVTWWWWCLVIMWCW